MTDVRRLLLIGGGHAHLYVLRAFGRRPLPGVELLLVGRDRMTPYSGMLPGHVAGHHARPEAHIDLARLAAACGIPFRQDEVVALDPLAREVTCRSGERVGYDLLSVDIGSAPNTARVPGAAEHAVPVKPIDRFLARWDALMDRFAGTAGRIEIGVVGGGAGGVELTLAMHEALSRIAPPRLHLIEAGPRLLPHHAPGVGRRLGAHLAARGVTVHRGFAVEEVTAAGLRARDGRVLGLDTVLWVTDAAAQGWLSGTGLATDERGFLAVDAHLRSVSHGTVFAAGDVAAFGPAPLPKAGVIAVRQGAVLADNLRRALTGRPLRAFRPPRTVLALIGTGGRSAVASYGPLALEGRWAFALKSWIDRRFMRKFRTGPE